MHENVLSGRVVDKRKGGGGTPFVEAATVSSPAWRRTWLSAISFVRVNNAVSAQLLPSVRPVQIEQRTDRHNPGGIDVVMRHVIVPLDMVEVHRLRDARLLEQIEHV